MAFTLVDPRQLKRLRLQLGMTQARLARDAEVSQSLVAKIEAGMVDPAFSSLKAISEALSSSRATTERKAADVMSSPVISVQITEKLSDCIALMKKRGISQMPVLEGGRSVGSITESGILTLLAESCEPVKVLSQPVRKFMGPALPVVNGDTPTGALLSLFGYVPAVLVSSGEEIEGGIAQIDSIAAEARPGNGPPGRRDLGCEHSQPGCRGRPGR